MTAYAMDLRNRMFNSSLAHNVRKTAEVFQVSPNTVQCLKKRFFETGQLASSPSHGGCLRVVSEEAELFLKTILRDEIDLTLDELRERYAAAYGV